MSIRHTALICACLGLPPPVMAQLPLPPPVSPLTSEAPWDPSPVPFSLSGELFQPDASHTVTRKLILQHSSGFDVPAERVLDLRGPICPDSAGTDPALCRDPGSPGVPHAPALLLKLGQGHLRLSGANAWQGNTLLVQGTLALGGDQALGHPANALDMASGARLELADGVRTAQSLQVHALETLAAQVPPDWALPSLNAAGPAAILHVEQGTASWLGRISSVAPLSKTGQGTLRLLGSGYAFDHPFTLRKGGLQVGEGGVAMGHFWFGAIHTAPGTILSGTGLILDASVAGRLQPGTPANTGTLLFGNHLQLADSAQTRIRVDAQGHADRLWSLGSARLGGDLWIAPAVGGWRPGQRWTIVQADGGLVYATVAASDPAAVTPAGISSGNGRFARVHSPVRYLDPVLDYGSQSVGLTFRYNGRGLSAADSSWRSALLDDSRFVRESAMANTGSGHAWARTWAANTERRGQDSLPGDDRDTGGVQLGVSRPVGRNWHIAAFTGWQDSRQHARPDAATSAATDDGVYRLRDQAAHLGLAAQFRDPSATLALGVAQSRHHVRTSRQVDPAEPALNSRTRAVLTQAWADIRPSQPLPAGDWAVIPWARVAWLYLRRPAVQENGGLAAVDLHAQTDQRWQTQLGIQAERRWVAPQGDGRLFAQASVRSLWGDRALHSRQAYRAAPDAQFDATGLPVARHALQLDVGVHAPVTQRVFATLTYTGQHGGGLMQHGGWLGVSIALDGKLSSMSGHSSKN